MMPSTHKNLIPTLLLFVVLIGSVFAVYAQDDNAGSAIEITGTIDAIDATTITVAGLVVELDDTIDVSDLTIGVPVTVSGMITAQSITATTIVIINVPEVTPSPEMTPDPEMTPEPESTLSPEMTPDPEMTSEPEFTPSPEMTPDPTTGDLIIVIEGPVTAININVITIFNFDIVLDSANPILTEIEIGQIVRVEGNLAADADTITIIAVNITIVNVVIIQPGTDGSGGGGVVTGGGFSKDACKNGGWQGLTRADGSGFRNQGDCIQYANTGK